MKRRNLVLCGILSMTLAFSQMALVSASETAGSSSLSGDTEAAANSSNDTDTNADNPELTSPEKPEGMENGSRPEGNPPEKPEGMENGNRPEGAPPEKPEDMENGSRPEGTPPEKPDGQAEDGNAGAAPPDMPEGEMPFREDGMGDGEMPGPAGGGPGMAGAADIEYKAVEEFDSGEKVIDGEDIESTGTDENAILVDGDDAEISVSNSTIRRSSEDSDSANSSSFYGNAAAALSTAGVLKISDSRIETDSQGGAGAFAYGDGTVYISDTNISTTKGTSGGIHVAGGGSLYAWDLTVNTEGGSSAAIRSDRGGGSMVVDGGNYTSSGTGSPAIYSTADITVHNAVLTAENSEAVCIEGLNTIRLFDCELSGNMPDDNELNDVLWNVIVYQSMSGDSAEGNGTFEMVGGTLTANSGGLFYTTNTESTFILKDVDITYSDENEFFLRCSGNANGRGWGQSGANGADCRFTAIDQEMEGDIIWDQISELDFYITDGSSLKGSAIRDDTYSGGSGTGYGNMYIDESSSWIVTADSTLTGLFSAGKIVDEDGNNVSIVGTDGTVYQEGTSEYTVTVDSYSDKPDLSGASSVNSWEDFQVERA